MIVDNEAEILMTHTHRLKAELWKRFGSAEFPAEWDGHVYGGGKLSQRFWEYFKAIELLDLDEGSVIVDIGGGSPMTGVGFFASLLSTVVRQVFIFDECIASTVVPPDNIQFIRSPATYETLSSFLRAYPEITHMACLSVFEHITPSVREGIIRAINDHFTGKSFVVTLEFQSKRTYFEHQLTAQSLSALVTPLKKYFLDAFESSPVRCENAYEMLKLAHSSHQNDFQTVDIPRL